MGVGVFLFAWAGIGIITLKRISDENDALVARLQAIREESETAERQLRASKRNQPDNS